uniref:Uncharacterized protein n=1 Tax=Phasianus colchicus TaxID=9054 RepID=A0A669QTE2_PHACC
MILSMISLSSFMSTQNIVKCSRPCGGRDCSGGCQCFPEKGARVSNIFFPAERSSCHQLSAICYR